MRRPAWSRCWALACSSIHCDPARGPLRRRGRSAAGDREQLVLREDDEAGRLDPHRAFALEALQLLVDALPRRAEQLRDVLLRELQADPDLVALLDAVAAREQQDLLGEPRRERQRVEVLDGVEQQPKAAAVEPEQRVVELDVVREQVLEVGLADDEERRRAV